MGAGARAESKDAQAVADFFTQAHAVCAKRLGDERRRFAPITRACPFKADFTRWSTTVVAVKARLLAEAAHTTTGDAGGEAEGALAVM